MVANLIPSAGWQEIIAICTSSLSPLVGEAGSTGCQSELRFCFPEQCMMLMFFIPLPKSLLQ